MNWLFGVGEQAAHGAACLPGSAGSLWASSVSRTEDALAAIVCLRSAVERAGLHEWLFEEEIDARDRLARAALHTLISSDRRRQAIERMGSDRADVRGLKERHASAVRIGARGLGITRPAFVGGKGTNPNPETWRCRSQTYPSLSALAKCAYRSAGVANPGSEYGVLSNFAHPSVLVGAELAVLNQDRFRYAVPPNIVARLTDTTARVVLRAINRHAMYFGVAPLELEEDWLSLHGRLTALTSKCPAD